MVFSKHQGETKTYISETQGFVDLEDDVQEIDPTATSGSTSQASGSQGNKQSQQKDATKPLIDEVIFHRAGNSKNPGGSRQWTCNHCKCRFTSTYTRIHVHFSGSVGKKAEIKRCPVVLKDRELFERLSKKVREAENSGGLSKCLKNSILSKNAQSTKQLKDSFGMLERNAVDLMIIRGLCANGIPFNVLRNPQFVEMLNALQNAPVGYKPPSCEKARTTLLDECVRNVEKELAGVIDAFGKITENEEEEKILREQFAAFCMKKGIYSRIPTQADAVTMDAIDWWTTYGAETSKLAEVAKKVLSQPISSSSAERNWSTYSYIHNVKRNRLNVRNADKLVFIHSNIRLQSRFSDTYKFGPHKKWDMNPDDSYIEGSSARLDEMRWKDLEDEGEGVNNGKGKKPRLD